MMIKRKDLTNRADKNIWIADDRISALISHSCQGIEQIDYHGAQPVSRNAKLLQHPAGVLKFELSVFLDNELMSVPLTWSNLSIQPGLIWTRQVWNSFQISLKAVTIQDTLLIFCRVKVDKPSKDLERLEFSVFWNPLSTTTEVHGRREWALPRMVDAHSILLKATDNIYLSEWLKRKGDYQGDFLIPEGWRRLIFNKQVISGLARYENVRPEYQDLPLKLYEADTWVLIGGANYERMPEQNSWVQFKANLIQKSSQAYHSPLFQVRFSYQSAEILTENLLKPRIIKRFFLQNKRYQALAKRVPQLKLQNYPAIEEFFRQTPLIVESAKVNDAGMTRACPGTYYWIWAWDNLVTAQSMLHWGDISFLKKMVNFLNIHRNIDSSIPGRWTRFFEPMDSRGHGAMDSLFSELVLALFSETNDKKILRANYTLLVHGFQYLKSRTHPNGLFPSFGMYPDIPQKMGRTEDFYVAIDQGTWYTFCRNLEKMALVLHDLPTAMQTREMAEKIQCSFLPTFWDEKQGFLCDSFHPQIKMQLKSYPIFSLLFFESPFGFSLLKEKIEPTAKFIQNHLLGSNGIKMTPQWDKNHTSEPAMSGWYPHWDFPTLKLLCRAQKWSAIQKWLNLVEECFTNLGYCPEFLSTQHQSPEIWQHHGAAWNLNCAAGWYNALLDAVVGISFDPGGISCHSTGANSFFNLKNLNFRQGQWDITKSGEGDFISFLEVDGERIESALKIPSTFYTPASHTLKIHYQSAQVETPALTELIGAELIEIQISKTAIQYSIQGLGTTDLSFRSTEKPVILFDDKLVPFEWFENKQKGELQLILSGKHRLTLQRKGNR